MPTCNVFAESARGCGLDFMAGHVYNIIIYSLLRLRNVFERVCADPVQSTEANRAGYW